MGGRSSQLVRSTCGCIAAALLLLWAVGPFFLSAAWVSASRLTSVLVADGQISLTLSESADAEIFATKMRNGRDRLSLGFDFVFDNSRPVLDASGQPSSFSIVWLPAGGPWSVWPGTSQWSGKVTYHVPYWCIAVPFAFVAFALDRHRRRLERANKCGKCGYSRSGLPAGAKCPECGAG
ncbi:MAG: hypothetical protein QM783_05965 [Phycisphaerales bacterium]